VDGFRSEGVGGAGGVEEGLKRASTPQWIAETHISRSLAYTHTYIHTHV